MEGIEAKILLLVPAHGAACVTATIIYVIPLQARWPARMSGDC